MGTRDILAVNAREGKRIRVEVGNIKDFVSSSLLKTIISGALYLGRLGFIELSCHKNVEKTWLALNVLDYEL